MTTTSTYTGMGDEPKPSSRVLKPPGGGSSNIFGSDDTAPSAPKPRAQASKPTDHAIFPGGAGSDGSSRAQRSARDGDNSFNRLFGDSSDPYQKGTSASQRVNTYSNIFGGDEPPAARQQQLPSTPKQSGSTYDHIFGDTPAAANGGGASGSYNPITGADYKDLAPNHHALHIRETPKAQKEQPPLPCSEGELQAKEGKMQNVQTSTRVTNPPGGKTHKLW